MPVTHVIYTKLFCVSFCFLLGKGSAGQGPLRHVGPLRARHLVAGQEAPARDQDQATDAQPSLERDILL